MRNTMLGTKHMTQEWLDQWNLKKTRLTDNLFKLNYSEKAEGYFITSKITKELESSRPEKEVLWVQTKK